MRWFVVAVPETPEDATSPLVGSWEVSYPGGEAMPSDDVSGVPPRARLHVVDPA